MGKHQPALLGGLFIGVLSSLPYVKVANCCCLWVIVGGLLVVYLQQSNKPTPVETGEAILGGLLAGVIGAVIGSVVAMLTMNLDMQAMQDGMREAFDKGSQQGQQVPPEVRDWFLSHTRFLTAMFIWGRVPIFAVFGMLGSLLGLAFFRKKLPPAPPLQG